MALFNEILAQIITRTMMNFLAFVLITKLRSVTRLNPTNFDFTYISCVKKEILYKSTLIARLFRIYLTAQMVYYKRPYA